MLVGAQRRADGHPPGQVIKRGVMRIQQGLHLGHRHLVQGWNIGKNGDDLFNMVVTRGG